MRSRPTACGVTRPDPAFQSETSAVPAVAAWQARQLPGPRSDSLPTEGAQASIPYERAGRAAPVGSNRSMGFERHPLPRTLSLTAIFLTGGAHLAAAGYPPPSGPTGEPDGRHGYSRRSSMEHVSVQPEQPDQQLVVQAEDPDIGQRSQKLSAFAGAKKRQDPLLRSALFRRMHHQKHLGGGRVTEPDHVRPSAARDTPVGAANRQAL